MTTMLLYPEGALADQHIDELRRDAARARLARSARPARSARRPARPARRRRLPRVADAR
jgi:hypothetical protein